MRQAGVIVVALVLALGAAACGGGGGGGDRLSKDEYEQQMSSIGADLQEASSGVDISSTTDLDKVADTVADFKDDLETAADKVDDLNPPEDAEAGDAEDRRRAPCVRRRVREDGASRARP